MVRRVLVNGGKSDGAPTAANIVNALGLLGRAQPNDTVAVFLAGHGINDGPNYRFLSTDAAMGDGMILPATVVPWYAIEEAVDGAKGRRLLFIDTCHSASAYNQRLGNAAYYANILAYSSARWDQEALESSALGHGLFTHALVEGLGGRGGRGQDRAGGHRAVERLFAEARAGAGQALPARAEPASLQGPRRGGVHARGAQVSRQDFPVGHGKRPPHPNPLPKGRGGSGCGPLPRGCGYSGVLSPLGGENGCDLLPLPSGRGLG